MPVINPFMDLEMRNGFAKKEKSTTINVSTKKEDATLANNPSLELPSMLLAAIITKSASNVENVKLILLATPSTISMVHPIVVTVTKIQRNLQR